MTGALTFILPLRDAGPSLWRLCRSLAGATAPGDRIVAVDGGSTDKTPALLRRFAADLGWGPEVAFELITLDDATLDLPALAAIGRDRARGGWCIEYRADDLVLATGIAALRARLNGPGADIVVANHAWMLAGPASPLPCPDAKRWPEEPEASAYAARCLAPDPQRVIYPSGSHAAAALARNLEPGARYDAALEAAQAEGGQIGFCPNPVRLSPLPSDGGLAELKALETVLRQLPAKAPVETFAPPLLRAGDALFRLPPAGAEALLDDAQSCLAALPRRLRKAVCAHDSPLGRLLGVLHKEGRGAARISLSLILAEAQRQQAEALRDEIAQLRADLDIALPEGDYLDRMRARARHI